MTDARNLALISTGGTIEKVYDELTQVLTNQVSVLDILLAQLKLEGTHIHRVPLMNKDSLDMSPEDHTLIAETAGRCATSHDGVVVVHGTDRLSVSGERTLELLGAPRVPIVFTGAMRPYMYKNTDAMQNVTEALLAAKVMPPGVYVAMHGQVLAFPGVVKDPARGTFVRG